MIFNKQQKAEMKAAISGRNINRSIVQSVTPETFEPWKEMVQKSEALQRLLSRN